VTLSGVYLSVFSVIYLIVITYIIETPLSPHLTLEPTQRHIICVSLNCEELGEMISVGVV
jgi:hypothetical protein